MEHLPTQTPGHPTDTPAILSSNVQSDTGHSRTATTARAKDDDARASPPIIGGRARRTRCRNFDS
jgi:hypothetical protein